MIEGKKHLILVLATIHFLTIVVHKLLSKFIDLSTTNLSINSINFCFIDLSKFIDKDTVYPQAMLEMIYSKLGIDPGLVNTCLPALETHSQKNFYGVASSKDWDVISKYDWNRLDQIFLTLVPFDTNVELDQFAQTFKANGISG
jgi:hypothetical protein